MVGHLTYEDNDLIGQGYITTERPSYEMIAEKKVEKPLLKSLVESSLSDLSTKITKKIAILNRDFLLQVHLQSP